MIWTAARPTFRMIFRTTHMLAAIITTRITRIPTGCLRSLPSARLSRRSRFSASPAWAHTSGIRAVGRHRDRAGRSRRCDVRGLLPHEIADPLRFRRQPAHRMGGRQARDRVYPDSRIRRRCGQDPNEAAKPNRRISGHHAARAARQRRQSGRDRSHRSRHRRGRSTQRIGDSSVMSNAFVIAIVNHCLAQLSLDRRVNHMPICAVAQGRDHLWRDRARRCGRAVLFSFVILLTSRYKRCPSNRVLVIYGKTGSGNVAKCDPRRGGVRLAADPGLRLPEPGADPDRSPAARRAVDREHPRQRAQRVHRGHRHQARGDAERGHPLAGPEHASRSRSRPRKSSSASCGR